MNRRLPSATLPLFLLLLAGLAGFAAPATAGDWRLVGLPGADLGAIALPASPLGAIDVSAADSVFHSTDRGKTFGEAPLFGSCAGVTSLILVADPAHPGTLYATAGSRVVKSTDSGATWLTATFPEVGWLVDLQAAPGVLVAVGDSSVLPPLSPRPPCFSSLSGIALSTDGGATWREPIQALAGTGVNSAITVDPLHPERIYLGTSAGYASVSLDGGASEVALPTIGGLAIDWLRVDTSTIPAALFASSDGQLYRMPLAADGRGTSWTRLDQAPPLTGSRSARVVFDRTRPGTLYAFSPHGVFTSTDRGDSWTAIPGSLDPASITGLALDPRPNGPLYAATTHGLYALDRSSCVEDEAGACLNGFRFKVGISFAAPGATAAPAHAQALSADTSDFWFFSPGNLELVVKVLDGRSVNHAFWVFSGGLSNVAYTMTVTDTATGAVQTYTNPQGRLASFADTSAFPDGGSNAGIGTPFGPPGAPPASCADADTALCLVDSRFLVAVSYQAGPFAGNGHAVPLTHDTGAFWFLGPSNVELILKVLDGRGVNGHFWVFYGALSDVAYTITVTDTATGVVKTYTNPQGHLASFADTSAF